MSSRMARVIVVILGIAALVSAAFTPGITPPPASTLQAGVHAPYTVKPLPLGLALPATVNNSKQDIEDTAAVYDYINPCSLVSIAEVHAITGDQHLLFESKSRYGLTTDVSDARVARLYHSETADAGCFLTANLDYVKVQLMIGISPSESRAAFDTSYQQENHDNNAIMSAKWVSTKGLPGAERAYMTYALHSGERHYQSLSVHTKAGQTLKILRANKHQLRGLATAALNTLDGSRYAGK